MLLPVALLTLARVNEIANGSRSKRESCKIIDINIGKWQRLAPNGANVVPSALGGCTSPGLKTRPFLSKN